MGSKETQTRTPLSGLQTLKYSCGPMAVTSPPKDYEDRLRLGVMVSDDIISLFESRLAPKDHALWHQRDSQERWTKADEKKILGAFDKTIIERAQTLGWRVYLSPFVLERMAKWQDGHEHGLDRIERLGQAVLLAARVACGQAKLPITEPEWRKFKPQVINELRRLFKQYRHVFNQHRSAPSYKEACEWLRQTVEGSPNAFPFLLLNLTSLFRYFGHAAQEDDAISKQVTLGDLRPGKLFDEWGAWGRNLSPDTFRQSISGLPSAKV